MAGEVRFTTYTCDFARLQCDNQGLDFVSCSPGASATEVQAVCREPGTQERLQRTLITASLGAFSGGLIFYFVDPKSVWKGAALGGFIGLLGSEF